MSNDIQKINDNTGINAFNNNGVQCNTFSLNINQNKEPITNIKIELKDLGKVKEVEDTVLKVIEFIKDINKKNLLVVLNLDNLILDVSEDYIKDFRYDIEFYIKNEKDKYLNTSIINTSKILNFFNSLDLSWHHINEQNKKEEKLYKAIKKYFFNYEDSNYNNKASKVMFFYEYLKKNDIDYLFKVDDHFLREEDSIELYLESLKNICMKIMPWDVLLNEYLELEYRVMYNYLKENELDNYSVQALEKYINDKNLPLCIYSDFGVKKPKDGCTTFSEICEFKAYNSNNPWKQLSLNYNLFEIDYVV